jgi:DNA polymerase-1
MPRTVIIDGDVVVYKVAEAVADNFDVATDEQDDFIYRNIGWASKERANEVLDTMINDICSDCKAQNAYICLSDMNSNFRKNINPLYKSNRRAIKPILYEYLRNYMLNSGYKVYERPSLEADDVIGILATSTKIIKGDKVVWSLDKDFKTIPCKFHRASVNGNDISEIITPNAADWWFMYQTLVGDTVDGYSGCKGIGDKTARKILGEIGEHSLQEMWSLVVATYEKQGFSKEEALLNARMARILRVEDYDFKNKEIKLWQI